MGRTRTKNKHLPQGVYFSKGWHFYRDGNRKWHKLGKEWDLAARLQWAQLSGNDFQAANRYTVASMLSDFMSAMQAIKDPKYRKSPRTLRDYEDHSKRLIKVFGKMAPDEVTKQHLARFLIGRKDSEGAWTPAAANKEISTLSSAYSWGLASGLAKSNPCFGVRRNKIVTDKHTPEIWEIRLVQSAASEKWSDAIELALLSGQRGVDIRKIKVSDITDQGLRITQSKGGSKVLIEWTPALYSLINRMRSSALKAYPETPWLFPGRQGSQYTSDGFKSSFSKIVTKAMETPMVASQDGSTKPLRLTRRFGFHSIRAANAVQERRQGKSAQRRLGHRTEGQTARYEQDRDFTRVQPLDLSAVKKLDTTGSMPAQDHSKPASDAESSKAA